MAFAIAALRAEGETQIRGAIGHSSPGCALLEALQRWIKKMLLPHRRRESASPLGTQGSYRECHRDAVIAEGIDLGAAQFLSAGMYNPSSRSSTGLHGSQVGGDGRDSVGFLHPQFGGILIRTSRGIGCNAASTGISSMSAAVSAPRW